MKKRIYLKKSIYTITVLGIIVFAGFYLKNEKQEDVKVASITEVKKKTVEVISFGDWKPNNYRKVLGTVNSSADISIHSNLSGNIEKVFVDIGDKVYKGEILAKFSRENDISQISYENAVNSLKNSRVSAQNSVQSAEINLENSKNDLKQAIVLTEQNHLQIFTVLFSQARNAETTISNSLNWADRILGVSRMFKYEIDPARSVIGKNNFILKNDTKNSLEALLRIVENSRDLRDYEKDDEIKILNFAREKNSLQKDTRKIIRSLDQLIRQTTVGTSFPQSYKIQLQQEVEVIAAKIDGNIVSLESQIEAAKSGDEQMNSNILAAKNRVKNAESNLNLAKSNADNQVSSLQNQINLAEKSLNDLNVRAPFDGVISAKFINDFDRVNPGQNLFSIVSRKSVPEVIAYLTAEETTFLNNQNKLKIELSNGEIIEVTNIAIAGKLDSVSQKMEVKFRGNLGDLLIGSIVKILIPVQGDDFNIVPISAISFEPDGAEVFVIEKGKVVRKKVQTGKIISNSVEILGGLEFREILVKYRNRVNAGDLVELKVNN